MKNIYFISGLPRSGSTLITNILKQNPAVHGEAVSSLSSLVGSVHHNWTMYEQNKEYPNLEAKIGLLQGMMNGYYSHINKPIIFDKDRGWVSLIGLVEGILEKNVKILICVRNPAEILTSFEKIRKENPMVAVLPDLDLREKSSLASRAFYYAGPEGPLGLAHRTLNDAIIMGYLDRMLFVDYNRFCNSPRSQLKRIYNFFELPEYEHDLENIIQDENYNHYSNNLPYLHKIKNKIEKTTVNPVTYLGLDLYEQYNKEIFWNAWI